MRPKISSLVIKLAQRCNLNCTYCYMYQHADRTFLSRPAFLSAEIFRAAVDRVAAYWDSAPESEMTFVFHGGEPMLFNAEKLSGLLDYANQTLRGRASYCIQTNGTLVSDSWIDLLRRYRIRASVSVDGTPAAHDQFRIDHAGRGSYGKTIEGLQRLMDARLDPSALCVVNPLHNGLEVYRHLRSLRLNNMDFLLPDATHDSKGAMYGGLGETPIADYLIPIFDAWMADDDPSVRIRFFTEIIRVLLGGLPSTDNLGASTGGQNYIVIDTDGSIQTTDVMKICYEGAGDSGLNVLESEFNEIARTNSLVNAMLFGHIPLSAQCQECGEQSICKGGAVPHRYSRSRGFDNPTIWCEDMKRLIAHIRASLAGCGGGTPYKACA